MDEGHLSRTASLLGDLVSVFTILVVTAVISIATADLRTQEASLFFPLSPISLLIGLRIVKLQVLQLPHAQWANIL